MSAISHPALAEIALATRTLVALVFLTAAYGKLRHFVPFQGVIANYRVLPQVLVTPVAYLLPPLEALLGAALLVGLADPWPELGAAVLLLTFAAAMGVNLRRGRSHIDCGCFQSALKQTLSWHLVVRNIVLSALLGVALLPRAESSDPFIIINGLLVGGVLFIILQALSILWSIVPAWRSPGHPGAGVKT